MQRSKTVLITGATDGIGLALARLYGQRGAKLVLVGRRTLERLVPLEPLLFTPDLYCQADLSQADCVERVVGFLEAQGLTQLDLVIHNAALGHYGDIAENVPERMLELIHTNLHAPIALTHRLLPHLNAAQGKLVFVSSVSAALAAPDYAVYTATKAGLEGFARSLRVELAGRVRVQVLVPGATRTGMHAKSGVPEGMNTSRFADPQRVAKRMLEAIDSPARRIPIGFGTRLLDLIGRTLPQTVDALIARRR